MSFICMANFVMRFQACHAVGPKSRAHGNEQNDALQFIALVNTVESGDLNNDQQYSRALSDGFSIRNFNAGALLLVIVFFPKQSY